jgi:cytochrome P450
MPETITIIDRSGVVQALTSPLLVPPPAPGSLQPGPTATLRQAMARFSHGRRHAGRRRAVLAALGRLDLGELQTIAHRRTAARLVTDRVDAIDLAFTVPTESMALALGVAESDLNEVLTATRAMVMVIGRGEPSSASTDEAVERLLGILAKHPSGPVAAASLLYQNHDATAALTSATIVADHRQRPRRPAVSRTVRIATGAEVIGSSTVEAGQTVVLDLATSGLERGAGDHECPGFDAAVAIVAGIAGSLHDAGYRLVIPDAVQAGDTCPESLPMVRTAS